MIPRARDFVAFPVRHLDRAGNCCLGTGRDCEARARNPWEAGNQERDRVRVVLSEIQPRSAQLLVLRYSGLTYAELADVFNVSKNSVGTLLARAEDEFEKGFIEQKNRSDEER